MLYILIYIPETLVYFINFLNRYKNLTFKILEIQYEQCSNLNLSINKRIFYMALVYIIVSERNLWSGASD